jgi:hypothetical protein
VANCLGLMRKVALNYDNVHSNMLMLQSASMKSFQLKSLIRLSFVAFLVSFPAMYYRRGFKEIVLYSAMALVVLSLAKLSSSDTERQWLVSAFAVSLSFWVVTNFRLLLQGNFEMFTLFSLVEAPFHFRDISRGSQDSSFFIRLEDKSYFQNAYDLSNPAQEHDRVLREIEEFDGLVKIKNLNGRYIKIRDFRRVTTGSTGLRQKRILIFGGSTIFCGEMPDSLTVPSQLQKIVLDNALDFDVLNFGIPGMRIENQFKYLTSITNLGSDDVVVFYDGVNDLNKVYKLGLDLRNNQSPWRQVNKIFSELENRSWFIRYLAPTVYVESRGIGQEYLGSQAKQLVVDNWFSVDKLARTYVEDKGATFVHILQPNLLTYTKASDIGKVRQKWSDMKAIENDLISYANETNKIKNFTKILDDLSTTPFFDWAHLDEIGNKKVAEKIFASLEALLDAK